MSIQVCMTDWWALHVCQEIQVKPSPLNSGFCILTLILFLELGGCCRKEVVCFPSLEIDLFAVTVCSISLWAVFQMWCIWDLLGKKRKWVRDSGALHTNRMKYRHSYILIFFLTVARERKDKNNPRGNSYVMYLMFQSLRPPLCGSGCFELSPSLWITCTFCTTQVHSWPVNDHTSYQVPQFILLYSSGCGSVQFKRSWPVILKTWIWDSAEQGMGHKHKCQAEGEKQAYVGCRWHRATLLRGFAFPRRGRAAVPLAAASSTPYFSCSWGRVSVTLCVCRMYRATRGTFIQPGRVSDGLLGMSQQELEAPRALWLSLRLLAGKQWGHSTSGCYLHCICCHCRGDDRLNLFLRIFCNECAIVQPFQSPLV